MQVLTTALSRIPSSLPCMQVLTTAPLRIPSSPPFLAPGALRALQRAALHDQALHARPDADRARVVARARPPLFRRAPGAGGRRRAPCGRGGRLRARGEPSRCRGRAAASGRVWREQARSDCKGARDARSTVVATRAGGRTVNGRSVNWIMDPRECGQGWGPMRAARDATTAVAGATL
jgi:hypothetical protein